MHSNHRGEGVRGSGPLDRDFLDHGNYDVRTNVDVPSLNERNEPAREVGED